ncbi:MAG TPA: choice-of-anchor tandem repeat GloVer-containing protein [Candidatus Sulfotelmatobacter sp.]|nr:choice-of-anchor tandem repeat GloVer-containing protein [Candidatus Sulfotelmatobacter sp.]
MRDRWNRAERCFLPVLIAIIAVGLTVPCHAQIYTTLVSFDGTNGANPYYGPLVQGRDGNLWGTTAGGTSGWGTIFKVTPAGVLTTMYNFCSQTSCADGYNPVAGLVLGRDGNFYGTTLMGGNEGCAFPQSCGVIFKITPKGVYTVLHTYINTDLAAGPVGRLIQASNGTFYGDGGIDNGGMAVFKVTSAGTYTEIASWVLATAGYPYGGVIQGTDGLLYGTTSIGGTGTCNDGCGTVFKIQTNGKKMVVLHSFNATDGVGPIAGLIQATDGYFYGATREGGSSLTNCQGNSGYSVCGTLFKISSGGAFTSLYSFCPETGCFDGSAPMGTPIQATDGNLYGTTYQGGALLGNGTIYQWNPTSQTYSTLYTFPGNDDTVAGLVQATNGKFYGTNFYGGNSPDCPYGCGAIFSFDMGLGPFVRPVTYSGKAGATIEILGQGFNKSTTTVSFNGTAATRTVASGTYLTAKVPIGATTGSITVTTGSTTLISDKIFTVLQ